MKIPKLSRWVIVSGVLIWLVSSVLSELIASGKFDMGIFIVGFFFFPFDLLFVFPEFFFYLYLVPYIAIPFYWLLLHQIDKRIQRRVKRASEVANSKF